MSYWIIMIISSYLDSFFTNIILTTISKDMNSSPVFEGLRRRGSDPKGVSENGGIRYTRYTPEWTLIGVMLGNDINDSPMDLGNSWRFPSMFFWIHLTTHLTGLRVGMPGNHTWGVETKHQPKVPPLPRRESASQSISIWRCPPNIGVPPGYPSNHSFLLRDLPCQWHKPSSCWGTPHGTHVVDTHPAIGKQWVRDPAGCAKDSSWDLVHLLLPRCRRQEGLAIWSL